MAALKVVVKLLLLIGPLRGFTALAAALGALGNLCAVAVTVFGVQALLLTAGLNNRPIPPLDYPAALLGLSLLCGLARGIFRYGEQICNHYLAFKLLARIREKVFAALRRLCPAKLEGKGRGGLIATLTADIELLEVFYAHTISPVAIAALTSAVIALFVGAYHPLFALIALSGHFAVGGVLPFLAGRAAREEQSRLRDLTGKFSTFYLDSLRGLSELLQFGRAGERKKDIGRRTEETDALRGKLNRRESAAGALSGFLVTVFSLLALSAGCLLRQKGLIGIDGLIIPVAAILSSFGPTLALADLAGALPGVLASGRRVLALLEEEPETPEITGGATPVFQGAESRNLSFAYDGEEVLRDLSVSLVKGRITGLTGRSGAGKSTFLKLLMRFWQPPDNTVFISGLDVNRIDTAHLRRMESFMTQSTDLFHASIAANILIGRPGASKDEMIAAAKKAALHDFVVSLPAGYDTLVGELGATLSGGERQRIGLARAFLHDAPLLLLDEPTSNLDSLNEGVILKALREEGAGRAVALVSHRLSTMGAADTVYSLEKSGPNLMVSGS
ncbi:MAG: ABC transporter ATP-binding protein/permease [Gracilibacteraceae bacterium]|nr:ABC transporter ATP-binding protein/permease [Gracilibacteraceae bacterium]